MTWCRTPLLSACGGSTACRSSLCRGCTPSRGRRSRTSDASAHGSCAGDLAPVAEPALVGDGALATAFNALSERDREVLRLVAWEGLSLADTATVLGCSAVACRVRYHRAKTRLASRLAAAASFRPEPEGVTR